VKSVTNSSPHYALTIGYKGTYIEERVNAKFLDLQLDNHLKGKVNIDQMIPKLSEACYGVRSMFHISNINTLKSIYFTYFHSITKYRIIFWGNSSNSRKVFTSQKKMIRMMVGAHPSTPCRSLFQKLEISPVPCQCIFY
jgi:hypothetical protein